MKKWSRRHTLIAGFAVILLTNAVALLGVGWNRSGNPESVLKLTGRELHRPYWGLNRENSGIALSLVWRIQVRDAGDAVGWNYAGGAPEWLDQAKMESLGFEVAATTRTKGGDWRADRQRSKEVLLVLELDGPTYRQAVERSRRYAAAEEAKLAANPDGEEFKRRAKQAHDRVMEEERENSRLFVIDAGLELAALRAKYPDRSRYAIVRGQVGAWRSGASREDMARGYINRISIDAINVPFEYRAVFERGGRQGRSAPSAQSSPFAAPVAFGQRLEPWILDVSFAEGR